MEMTSSDLSTNGQIGKWQKSKDSTMVAPMSKRRIMKNLFVICLGFLFLFSAYQALANLQSTVNSEENLGVESQSIIYASLIISALFLPKLCIKTFGCKWTLVVSILTYCPYIAANFYPSSLTLIPTSILIGLGAAPLWSAKCTYLNQISSSYAAFGTDSTEIIVSRFFGIFFMVFQNTQVWGNLVSYYVLKPSNSAMDDETFTNSSLDECGVWFFNGTNPNLEPPSDDKRYALIGIYLGCASLAAIVVTIFLDPLDGDVAGGTEKESFFSKAVATLVHMKKPNQFLLIPLTIFSGIEQAFIWGEFTKAYVACAWGVHRVGFVLINFGVVNAAMSFISGRLVQYIPRMVIMLAGASGNIVTCIGLFLWKPSPEDSVYFFVAAGVWGFSDAIWQTQINAFYGVLFKANEEAGFSNYRLWESTGFSIAFAYSGYLIVAHKIYVLLVFLAAGMTGYVAVEIRTRQKKNTYKMNCDSIKDVN